MGQNERHLVFNRTRDLSVIQQLPPKSQLQRMMCVCCGSISIYCVETKLYSSHHSSVISYLACYLIVVVVVFVAMNLVVGRGRRHRHRPQ